MKKPRLLIGLAFLTSSSFAQTNTFPSSGNVGIGTTNPNFPLVLEVPPIAVNTTNTILNFSDGRSADFQIDLGVGNNTGVAYGLTTLKTTSYNLALAVNNGSSYVERMRIASNGNVGIGTTNPNSKLVVQSSDSGTGLANGNFLQVVNTNASANTKAGISLTAAPTIGSGLSLIWSQLTNAGTGASTLNFSDYDGSWHDPAMTINGGNVGIGTTNPQSTLAVNGTITGKQVTVTQTGWSDFVFNKGYRLRPLSAVESYIRSNKHLPGIPSAKEIADKGLDLGNMEKKQMQKIEELTLYTIQQNKKNEEQDKIIGELIKTNKELKRELSQLKGEIIQLKGKK